MTPIEEKIRIDVGPVEIEGTFVTPGTLLPGVLFVHGWGGSQKQYLSRAREVATLGCACLAFDLRGHEQTRGQFETVTRADSLEDVLAAYDLLASRAHVDPQAIAVVGSSYGGYMAALLTTLRPVKWLALRAPALYIDEGWNSPKLQLHRDHDLRAYRLNPHAAAENRALGACQAFDGDVLLIESEGDTIVPKAVLTSYREATRQARSVTYRCIAGADHGLTSEHDQKAYSTLLVGWLKEMIVGARRGVTPPPERVTVEEPHPPETPPPAH